MRGNLSDLTDGVGYGDYPPTYIDKDREDIERRTFVEALIGDLVSAGADTQGTHPWDLTEAKLREVEQEGERITGLVNRIRTKSAEMGNRIATRMAKLGVTVDDIATKLGESREYVEERFPNARFRWDHCGVIGGMLDWRQDEVLVAQNGEAQPDG